MPSTPAEFAAASASAFVGGGLRTAGEREAATSFSQSAWDSQSQLLSAATGAPSQTAPVACSAEAGMAKEDERSATSLSRE
jgi:hypothetical protein